MAGRIRTIKPELLEDERAAALSDRAWRLSISAILLADDHGNLRANARYLRGAIWWAREEVSSAEVEAAIAELEASELLEVYGVREQFYGHLRSWEKHQRMDNAGKPRVPQPNEADTPSPSIADETGARSARSVSGDGAAAVTVAQAIEIVRAELGAKAQNDATS